MLASKTFKVLSVLTIVCTLGLWPQILRIVPSSYDPEVSSNVLGVTWNSSSTNIDVNNNFTSQGFHLNEHQNQTFFILRNATFIRQKWNKSNKVFLYHTRKAGGTTLRMWSLRMTRAKCAKFVVQEGYTLSTVDIAKSSSDALNNTSSYFLITSIRDPISRIISSFDYEGRWGKGIKPPIPPWPAQGTIFNLTFDKWIEENRNHPSRFVWQCSSNCLVKWFSGWNGTKTDVSVDDLKKAIRMIGKFDLVVCSENLINSSYVSALEQLFDDAQIPYKTAYPASALEAKAAKLQYPYTIENKTIEYLKSLNYLDILFYKEVSSMWC